MVIDMFTFRGAWEEGKEYKKGDYVTIKDYLEEGHGFVAIKDTTDSPLKDLSRSWIEHVPLPSEIKTKVE